MSSPAGRPLSIPAGSYDAGGGARGISGEISHPPSLLSVSLVYFGRNFCLWFPFSTLSLFPILGPSVLARCLSSSSLDPSVGLSVSVFFLVLGSLHLFRSFGSTRPYSLITVLGLVYYPSPRFCLPAAYLVPISLHSPTVLGTPIPAYRSP